MGAQITATGCGKKTKEKRFKVKIPGSFFIHKMVLELALALVSGKHYLLDHCEPLNHCSKCQLTTTDCWYIETKRYQVGLSAGS